MIAEVEVEELPIPDLIDPHEETDWDYLTERVESITDHIETVTPSVYAEENRYLPASVTSVPGYYDYDVFPFLREIVDCMDVRSPVREVSVKKGAQIGYTTGVLENAIAYSIGVIKSAPTMFVTADADIAQIRMDQNVTPMVQQSCLEDCIQSGDEMSKRKSGKTNKKLEWRGGGYLLPFGANNAGKLRSFSIRILLEDEIDGWKNIVGRDGDPCALAEARTKGYHQVRKILRGSTPLLAELSKIDRHFKDGDQRYFYVKCLACGEPQPLRFSVELGDGRKAGLVYRLDENGMLDVDSVRYACPHCGNLHRESDKPELFASGEWVPTAIPKSPEIRSYHISALYSPNIMFTWAACVQAYLDGYDVEQKRMKDATVYQEFYNNVLGETFEIRSNRIKLEQVTTHKRSYQSGVIPNKFAQDHCGGLVGILTCAVDVHKNHLDVAVMGWTQGKRCVVIEDFLLEGDCKELESEPWQRLEEIITNKVYKDEEEREYRIQLTLIDSGYDTDLVCEFCDKWEIGVAPIQGREAGTGRNRFDPFTIMQTKLGLTGFHLNVDLYKDRWNGALRREWDGLGLQPENFFNAPSNISAKRLRELTAESKVEVVDKETGRRKGWKWHRPSGAANELWDLLVYNSAALDLVAWELYGRGEFEVDWVDFWAQCAEGLYFDAG